MSDNPLRDAIAEAIRDNEVILFMKGTPEQPMCGFSARAAAAIQAVGGAIEVAVTAGARAGGCYAAPRLRSRQPQGAAMSRPAPVRPAPLLRAMVRPWAERPDRRTTMRSPCVTPPRFTARAPVSVLARALASS